MIVNIRIDERLIHGQVSTMWTNHLRVDRILVVDDAVVSNEIEKEVLIMAKPASVKLSILTVKGAAMRMNSGQYQDQRIFLIVKSPQTLADLLNSHVKFDEINVGNMSTKQHSQQIAKSIAVTNDDILAFKEINAHGVKIISQMVPNDEKKDFITLLKGVTSSWN